MGDVGSLAIGGVIGVAAVLIRKELLLPLLCGVFFSEAVSVMLQNSYFAFTKKKMVREDASSNVPHSITIFKLKEFLH